MSKRWGAGLILLGALALFSADGTAQPPKGPPPEPGTVLPPFAREPLKLTQDQQRQLAELEKDTKAKLTKILSAAQLKQFNDVLRQGPPKEAPPKGPPPGMAEPGLVVPPFVRDKLRLQEKQAQHVEELEKAARDKLDKILTEAQKKQFHDLLRQGPGGQGRPQEGKNPKKQDPGLSKPADGIQWFATLAGGLEEARRTGRPILLVSAAPHCAGVSGVW
jgi:Spy/CpxP family protein refolding chaperone